MTEPELYLLDWEATQAGTRPSVAEVQQWLIERGFVVDAPPKVYANGTVQVSCYPDPRDQWPQFDPAPATAETQLQLAVAEVVKTRARILRQAQQSPTEEALVAVIDLLLFGYGIRP